MATQLLRAPDRNPAVDAGGHGNGSGQGGFCSKDFCRRSWAPRGGHFLTEPRRSPIIVGNPGGPPVHILCPHCRNPIEMARLTPREEITCPSCGSTFRLETGSTFGGGSA